MKRALGLTLLVVALVFVVGGVIASLRSLGGARTPPPPPLAQTKISLPAPRRSGCTGVPAFDAAAADNARSLATVPIAPFGRAETGWEIYAPLIGQETGSACNPQSSAFAAAVAHWQSRHAQPPDGRVLPQTVSALTMVWLTRRPFVVAMRRGCPSAPDPSTLEAASPEEVFGGKTILARPGALSAYRAMRAKAMQEPALQPPMLTLVSGFRGPEEEAQRCADGSCGTASKARCSAHRTGLAFDFFLGAAPGSDPISSSDSNRLMQTRTAAYRWLVAHAAQFGFIPYPFEPWHWEWTGEPV